MIVLNPLKKRFAQYFRTHEEKTRRASYLYRDSGQNSFTMVYSFWQFYEVLVLQQIESSVTVVPQFTSEIVCS